MHTPRNALAALLLLPCILPAASPPRVERWEASSSPWRVPPIWRGETVGLECDMAGLDLSGAEASFHWQTNGMGALWWPAPATATNGLISAIWTPAMDCGADTYRFFVRAETAGGITYRANGSITMLGSPGETPNALPLPVHMLDFDALEVSNAPWATPDDVATAVETARFAASPVTSVNGATGDVVVAESDPVWLTDRTNYWTRSDVMMFVGANTKGFVPATRTVAGHALTDNVSLGMSDITDLVQALSLKASVSSLGNHIADPDIHVSRSQIDQLIGFAVSASAMALTNYVDTAAIGELAAIRAAADEIVLPEDPTAAELGAAFRDLLLCIRNPTRARALRAAIRAPEESR